MPDITVKAIEHVHPRESGHCPENCSRSNDNGNYHQQENLQFAVNELTEVQSKALRSTSDAHIF